jgi:phosphoribosylglycinamide formyltransferase-1
MPDVIRQPAAPKARVAVLLSGSGTNMAALLYASRAEDCPYEIVLVASNNPQAGGLALAAAEGIPTFALPHKGMTRAEHDGAMDAAIREAGAEYVALAGYMRILTEDFVRGWEGGCSTSIPRCCPPTRGCTPISAPSMRATPMAASASIW